VRQTQEDVLPFLANVNSGSRSLLCCRLSVCNVRAPYSGGSNFRQYFYGIWYLDHPLTSTENFYGDRPRGTPPPGELNTRRVVKYSDFGSKAVSRKRCKIGGRLLLITHRKSYMGFRLLPKLVTLNDLERRNGRYFALFHRTRVRCHRKTITSVLKSTFNSL